MTATISSVSGKLPNELTTAAGLTTTDIINKKYLPTEEEDALVKASIIRYNKLNYIPHPSTPSDFVVEMVMVKRERPIASVIEEIRATFEKYPKSVPNKRGTPRRAEDYFVTDANRDAPTIIDPRIDDGMAPPAPTGVKLEQDGGNYKITFQPVSTADVVGYRIYMSKDTGPFSRFSNLVVYTGEEAKFLIGARSPNDAFYITSVDVGGHESSASNLVFASGMIDPNLMLPIINDPLPGNNDSQVGAPSPPQGVQINSRDDGVGILLQWDSSASDSVKRYNVYYSSSPSGSFNLIGSTEKTRFEYISFPSEGWYRVTAVGSSKESSPSQAVEMKQAE